MIGSEFVLLVLIPKCKIGDIYQKQRATLKEVESPLY